MEFILTRATRVAAQWNSLPVQHAIRRMRRDMEMTLSPTEQIQSNEIVIALSPTLPPEGYTIDIQDERSLIICAADDLGAIYALLYLSRTCLGLEPLWFWNDQFIEPKPLAAFTENHVVSESAPIALRGWALDAEPMLAAWANTTNRGWEMALEALLRLGGNTVLPPPEIRTLAAAMGLWVVQDVGEPLGAMPFEEVYPSLDSGWNEQKQAYRALWSETVRRHRTEKTVWYLGLRGAHGQHFWADDPTCITVEQRGRRLSEVLQMQRDIVMESAPNAHVYTRLTAEELPLYRNKALELPEDVILLWSDKDNNNLEALPEQLLPCRNGIDLHLAAYDGQGGNLLTMLPQPVDKLQAVLQDACEKQATGLWLMRAPGLRPHLYPLDLVAAMWRSTETVLEEHRTNYLRVYYRAPDGWTLTDSKLDDLATCLKAWGDSTIVLPNKGRAGEQFTVCGVRALATAWLGGGIKRTVPALQWLTGDRPFVEQLVQFRTICVDALSRFETLAGGCEFAKHSTTRLWRDTIQLQTQVYLCCLRGAVRFCDGCALYVKKDYEEAFTMIGQAADDFTAADALLQTMSEGRWSGFYQNECQTDLRATVSVLCSLMAMIRATGDSEDYRGWQRQYMDPSAEWQRRVDDQTLYWAMRKKKKENWL